VRGNSRVAGRRGSPLSLGVPDETLDPQVADLGTEEIGATSSSRCASSRISVAYEGMTWKRLPSLRAGVGEKQMVVDDQNVGRRGLLPHAREETGVVVLAGGAQAGLGPCGHVVPQGVRVGEEIELRPISAHRGGRPFLDLHQPLALRPGVVSVTARRRLRRQR